MSWSQRAVQELCKIVRGASPRPIQHWMTEREDGIPWIKISDATAANGRTIERTNGRILQEGQEKSVSVYKGDLILSNSATPGIPKFVGIHACIHDGWLLLREFRDTVPEFLFYLLKHERRNLVAQGNGSVFTNLKTDILKNHIVSVPSIGEQKAIALILGTLDDKIELNQKMNQTLEETAKTIFKSWFVDFDPVRTKADGRPTGLPPEISDLFPAKLVDSEIGMIPKGWDCKRVETFADALLGGTPSRKKSNYWGGDIPWINSGAVNEFRIIEPSEYITQEGHDKSSTKLLPAKTTVIAITGATLGQVSYLEIDSCANQSVVGIIPHDNRAHEWIYLTFNAQIDRLINRQTGGAQQHINKNDVLDFDIVYPPEALIASFSEVASPLFQRIGTSVRENLILTLLRDTLLPKLISGELRIPDAEKFLENAGI